MALSTLAVINSARKVLERSKLNASVNSSPVTPLTAQRLAPATARRFQAVTAGRVCTRDSVLNLTADLVFCCPVSGIGHQSPCLLLIWWPVIKDLVQYHG